MQSMRPIKGDSLRKNTSYEIVKTGRHPFLRSTSFYPSSRILCFIMLFNRPHTQKCPFPWGHLSPC